MYKLCLRIEMLKIPLQFGNPPRERKKRRVRKTHSGDNLQVYDTRAGLVRLETCPDSLEYLEMHKLGMRVQGREINGKISSRVEVWIVDAAAYSSGTASILPSKKGSRPWIYRNMKPPQLTAA